MTDNTTYREKGRALFLAALMVLSVVAMTAALPGGVVAAHGDDAADLHSGNTYWEGQDVTFTTNVTSDTWNVYAIDGDSTTFQTQINVRDGHVVFDTSRLDADEYSEFAVRNSDGEWVTFDSGAEDSTGSDTTGSVFTILTQDLNVSFQSDTVSDLSTEVGVDVTDDRGEQNLLVEADGLNGEELAGIFSDEGAVEEDEDSALIQGVQNDQELNANFTGVSTGEYTFTFTSEDTGVTSSDDVEVVDGGDVDAQFESSSVSDNLGDIAEITVELDNTKTADIQIGGESNGWLINATVTDGDDSGNVTVLFNTADAGTPSASDVLDVEGDDDNVSVDQHWNLNDNVLATGSYDMRLETQGMQTARGTLNLQEGSIDSASTYKASGSADFDNADDLRDVLDADGAVAEGDYAVIEVAASGIYGYENSWSDQGIELLIEQSTPGMNQQPVEITDYETYADGDNNQVYYVIDTTDLIESNGDVEDGEEFNFSLSVDEEANDYLSEGATVSSTFTVNEPTVEFAQDEHNVGNAEEQGISGTSNLASGSEVDVTAQTGGDNAFFNQETAEVGENGDWTAVFDFSERSVGTEFDLEVVDPNSDADAEASGVVGEADVPDEEVEINVADPGEITVGEDAAFDVTVTNNKAEEVTTNVTFEFDGESEESELTIDAESSASETFTVSDLEEGEYAWSVSDSDFNFSDSGTLTVAGDGKDNKTEDNSTEDNSTEDDSTEDDSAENDSDENDSDDTGESDDDGQPGFGVAVAIVALLAAAMLALRRQD